MRRGIFLPRDDIMGGEKNMDDEMGFYEWAMAEIYDSRISSWPENMWIGHEYYLSSLELAALHI